MSSVLRFLLFLFLLWPKDGMTEIAPNCVDLDPSCREWVNMDRSSCDEKGYIQQNCRRSCLICVQIPKEFDVKRTPPSLQPLAFLVGIWRSEHDGKAFFPTIPKFTYGEQTEFRLPDDQFASTPALNYSTFAWAMNGRRTKGTEELHSETGYLAVQLNSQTFALTTVMSNGFVTVEEGKLTDNRTLIFRLKDIGRITFSRDLPVHDLIREWRLINPTTLEARLSMATQTHGMREHTTIVYRKIFP